MKNIISGILLCLLNLSFTSKAETSGEALVKNWKKPYRQSVSFTVSDLKLTAEFPLHTNQPLVINGYDNLNKPFKLEITTTEQNPGFFHAAFKFSRDKQLHSSSIIFEKDKKGKVSTNSEDVFHNMEFETKIID